ncbi:MAG: YbaK/EbsC family protein [Candidatus Promineifilaceae bacterium]|nr:YbaK/EbsC family protein [Candidatus Promineifilaceae bacterium]
MSETRLHEFLNSHQILYTTIEHSPAYTAQEIAASSHTPGKELAKSVIVKLDGRLVMAVLPASYRINFDRLREASGAQRVELANEGEFEELFPDCQLGAMPPFGNLYGMEVLVDESLAKDDEIAFNACNHHELIRLAFEDFRALVQPQILAFTWQPYVNENRAES